MSVKELDLALRKKRSFDFTEPERVALESAAAGMVSGKLVEWPILQKALEKAGCAVFGSTLGFDAREMARLVLDLESALNEKNSSKSS